MSRFKVVKIFNDESRQLEIYGCEESSVKQAENFIKIDILGRNMFVVWPIGYNFQYEYLQSEEGKKQLTEVCRNTSTIIWVKSENPYVSGGFIL